ncbi:hypothetical protein GWK08_07215 [Leptobacterium flavescens]|uniref:ATP synthase protein I n=1 Tax=Leptobacterium flavescens TaxID=472055 RepID=A0A6P0UQT1_9FLAO|nr:hypothetical protein [Leptobacterium flavescens]NER13223.1 hypothetical protein [Leptobacterium flavescens]
MHTLVRRFLIALTLVLLLVFGIHVLILYLAGSPLFDNSIVLSYIVNFAMAVAIYAVLFLLREKQKEQLGFIFIGGSMFKFLIFFLVFNPIFKADGETSNLEFASFFVPYLTCLIIETLSVIKLLKK